METLVSDVFDSNCILISVYPTSLHRNSHAIPSQCESVLSKFVEEWDKVGDKVGNEVYLFFFLGFPFLFRDGGSRCTK